MQEFPMANRSRTSRNTQSIVNSAKLAFNADTAAIAIALALAALIRLNIIHHIGW
jgi:hypothetical protein